jgi:hypothetical protein
MAIALFEGFRSKETDTDALERLAQIDILRLLDALRAEQGLSRPAAVETIAVPAPGFDARALRVTLCVSLDHGDAFRAFLSGMLLMCLVRYVREEQLQYSELQAQVVDLCTGRTSISVWENATVILLCERSEPAKQIEAWFRKVTERTTPERRVSERAAFNFVWLAILATLQECRQALLHRRALRPIVRTDVGM